MDYFYDNVNDITYDNISKDGADKALNLHTSVDIIPNINYNDDIFTYLPRTENIPCDKYGYKYDVVYDEENGGKKLSYTTETSIFHKQSDGSYKYINGTPCDENGYVLDDMGNYKKNSDNEKYKLFVNLSPCDYKVINDSNWIRTYKEESQEIPCDLEGYVYAVDEYGNKIKYHGYTKKLDGGKYYYIKQISEYGGINSYKTLCDVDGYIYTKDWVKFSEDFPSKVKSNELIKYKDLTQCYSIIDGSLDIKVDATIQGAQRISEILLQQIPSQKEKKITIIQDGNGNSQYCEFNVKNKQDITINTLDENYQMYGLNITKTNISINNLSSHSYVFKIPLNTNISKVDIDISILDENNNEVTAPKRVYQKIDSEYVYIDGTPCDETGYVYDVDENNEKYNVVYSSSYGTTQLIKQGDATSGYYYKDGENIIPCDENGYVYAVDIETNEKYKLFEYNDTDGIYVYVDGTLCDKNGYVYAMNHKDEFIDKNVYDYCGIYSYVDDYNNLYVGLSKNKTSETQSYTVTLIYGSNNIKLSLEQRPCVNYIDVITTSEWYTMTDVVESDNEVKFKYCDNEGHIYKTHKLKKECVLNPYNYFYENGTPCNEEGYVLNDSGDFVLKDGEKYKLNDMFILPDKIYQYIDGTPCDKNGYVYDVDSGGALYTTFKKIDNEKYQYLDRTPCDKNGYILDDDSDQIFTKDFVIYNNGTEYYYVVDKKKIPCDKDGYVYSVDSDSNKITKIVKKSTTEIYRSDYGELCNNNGYVYQVENNGVANGFTENKIWETTIDGNFQYKNEILCDIDGYVFKYNNFKVFNEFDENKHSYIDGTPCDENGYVYDVDENFRKKRKIKFNTEDVTCKIIPHNMFQEDEITTKGIYTCDFNDGIYACDVNGYKLKTNFTDGTYESSNDERDRCIERYSEFEYRYLDGTPCDKNGYIFYNDNNVKKRKFEYNSETNEYIFDNRIICDVDGFIYDLNEDNKKYKAYTEERTFIDYKYNDVIVDKDGYIYHLSDDKLQIDNTTQFNVFNNNVFYYYNNPETSSSKEYTITLSDDRDYVYIPFIAFNNLGQKLFLKKNVMVNIANVEQIIPPKEIENYDKIIIYKVYIEDLEEKSTSINFTYEGNNFKFNIVKTNGN